MNVEAHLVGGPGNGRIMAIDGIKREIVIAHMERPISFNIAEGEDPFARVPLLRYSYRPANAVVYYEIDRVEKR